VTEAPRQGGSTLSSSEAWAALIVNLLVVPGGGSLMLRRKSGWLQMLVAVVGAGITFYGGIIALRAMYRFSVDTEVLDTGPLWWMAAGFALFLAAWLWGLATAVQALRSARAAEHIATLTKTQAARELP
jgi:hypothetical protein